MEPLIYYPTFEPPTEIWLKFALLYFENFKPIVPRERTYHLSDDFRRIIDNTDLVSLYSPDYSDGYNASLVAIEETERYFNAPHSRSFLLREHNVITKWQNPDNWKFEVCQEKFSIDWSQYCLEKNIGRRTNEGILLPEELAFLFMTFLAKEVAFKESAAIITDSNKYDSVTNFYRASTPSINGINCFSKNIIQLLVPTDLEGVSFSKLIAFRNRNRDLIREFNLQIEKVQDKIASGYSDRDFIDSFNNVNSEIAKEILRFGLGTVAIPFAFYTLLHNPAALESAYSKEVLSALGVVVGGVFGLRKGLKDNRSRRYCKKYFSELETLGY